MSSGDTQLIHDLSTEDSPPKAQRMYRPIRHDTVACSRHEHPRKRPLAAHPSLAALAAVSGVQITMVEVKGNRGKFVRHMMRTIMEIDPNMRVN